MSFQKYICWRQERLGVVINKTALEVDRASFLATHAPLSHLVYLRMPHEVADVSEGGLLNELLACANAGEHTFVVVQGTPGTGKSHLIRWLKEMYQARQREVLGRDGDEVLLISRADSSLRGTLQQILKQVTASESFDTDLLRDQLDKLQSATNRLSTGALAESILGSLHVAVQAVELDAVDCPKPRIARSVDKFLLDYTIREQL